MSEDIDFIVPEIRRIQRPPLKNRLAKQQQPKKQQSRSFEIQKSFVPEPLSQVHQQLRPQLDELKKFIKLKRQREKKEKQLIAEGVIVKKEKDSKEQKPRQEQRQNLEKYKVDEAGHLRDEHGNLVFVKSQRVELKINQKKQQQQQIKQLGKKQRIKFHEKLSRSFLDRNLVISGAKKRIRRSMLGLQFLEKGSYQPYSERKVKQQVKDLDQIAKKQAQQPKIIRKRVKTNLQFNREVPKIQWWDQQIVLEQKYMKMLQQNPSPESIDFAEYIHIEKLNNQVVFQKVGNGQKKQQKYNIPLYLTKDERKKLKRKRKKQKLMQKNDMIKLGLIQPEKPRLKISNMAIVMKDEFIIDPSKVESEAKKQQEQRLNKHLQSNAERKLTKTQRKQKAIKKLKKDSAKETRRIVFKISRLEEPTHVFKVNMNAKQLALNGFILKPAEYHSQPVIVMAQGGQKAIRFFKNLMLNRIKWHQKDDNRCELIWEGEVESSKLGKWRTIEAADQSQTIRALAEKGVDNFSEYLI